jgi:predicted permease
MKKGLLMSGLTQDLRYGLRQLRKNMGLTIVAVVMLSLAVGANTAIFSVVRAVLLRSLPYHEPDRLVMIWGRNLSREDKAFPVSEGDFWDWKQKNTVFEGLAGSFDNQVTLTGSGEPKLVLGYNLTPNYFDILQVTPSIGRTFSEDEARAHADVVVLSHEFWQTTLHADPRVLGKSITLDAKPYTIIGVMPGDFDYPPRTELWMPAHISPRPSRDYDHRYIRVIGRLKPGVTVAQAQRGMDALEGQIAAWHPQTDGGNQVWVQPLRDQLAGDIRTPLLALFGAVGIVLVIACANLAGLMLARAASRRNETSVRVAIGASYGRLLQQHLCEGLALGFMGGALGVILAVWCTRFLVAIFPHNVANLSIPRIENIPIDGSVLGFALLVTLLTVLVFSLVPSLDSAKANPGDSLKESTRAGVSGMDSLGARSVLVSAEVALALLLLTGAGLVLESFRHAYQQTLGFHPEGVLALEVFLPPNRYPATQPEKRRAFVNNVMDGLKKLPGVRSAAAINFLPLTGFWGTTDFTMAGQPLRSAADKPYADNRLITPGYFSTLGISLLRGRDFEDSDRSHTESVAIVNSALARQYFAGQDPIGKVIELGDPGHVERSRIVGVVSDVKAFGPEKPAHADLYRPLSQVSFPLLAFTLRSDGDPSRLLNAAKQVIWSVDKDQPIFDAMPLSVLAAQAITLRRVTTILIASFAGLSLLLAAVGLYGLMAYSVSQRTQEIGIRMALGAGRDQVLGVVVRSGLRLVIAGEVIGVIAARVATRALSSFLFGVNPVDERIALAAVAVLTGVSIVAASIPAWRAMKIDPMLALHYQ